MTDNFQNTTPAAPFDSHSEAAPDQPTARSESPQTTASRVILDPARPNVGACPVCRGEVDPLAEACRHCGALLRNFKSCPQCHEAVRDGALVCRFCHYDFTEDPLRPRTAEEEQAESATLAEATANPLGGMLGEGSPTNLFYPPLILLNRREIVVRRWFWFGLRRSEQKVSLNRVASVRTNHGIIWSNLVVETLGGSIEDLVVSGVEKEEAEQMARVIEYYTLYNKKPANL